MLKMINIVCSFNTFNSALECDLNMYRNNINNKKDKTFVLFCNLGVTYPIKSQHGTKQNLLEV